MYVRVYVRKHARTCAFACNAQGNHERTFIDLRSKVHRALPFPRAAATPPRACVRAFVRSLVFLPTWITFAKTKDLAVDCSQKFDARMKETIVVENELRLEFNRPSVRADHKWHSKPVQMRRIVESSNDDATQESHFPICVDNFPLTLRHTVFLILRDAQFCEKRKREERT